MAFSAATGLSTRLLDDLETGRRTNYSDTTLATVEAALGWSPGSCLRIVHGGRARREIDPALQRLMDAWPRLSVDSRKILASLAEAALEE